MDQIKTLASMEIGEEGHVIQILGDQQVYHKLIYLGFQAGILVAVERRQTVGITQVPSIFVRIGNKTVVLPEKDAAKVIVKVKGSRSIPYWERPEAWRPIWPFYPRWGGVYQ